MGLLDDLKAEKEKIASQREQEAVVTEHKDEQYRTVIKPQIKALFAFLQEMIGHLDYINPDITVEYRLPGNFRTGKLLQKNYALTADSSDQILEIWLRAEAVAEKPFMIPAETDQTATTLREKLTQYGLKHTKRSASGSGIMCAALIEVSPTIPISFHFLVDKEKGGILLTIKNYAQLGIIKEFMKADDFGEQWREDIGELVLRRSDKLLQSNKLSDDQKAALRQHLKDSHLNANNGDESAAAENTTKQQAGSLWKTLVGKK